VNNYQPYLRLFPQIFAEATKDDFRRPETHSNAVTHTQALTSIFNSEKKSIGIFIVKQIIIIKNKKK